MLETPLASENSAATEWRKVPALALGLTALLALMVTAFILPAVNSGPHDVPIAVAGPQQQAEAMAERVRQADPDAYDIRLLPDAGAAREQIDDREIYGAVVVGGADPEVLVSTTASTQIAARLRALAPTLAEEPAPPAVVVNDLHPLPEDDPNGVGLSAGALPLVLGGYIAAMAISLVMRRPAQQAAAAFGFALAAGFGLTALVQYGLDVVDGNYAATSLAMSFVLAATAWAILGLRAVLGAAGLLVGAALMILLGNPLSGMSGGPEWLPSGWGNFGQYLPPGAGGSLLRSLAYFDGAGSGRPLAVLTCWLAAGIALGVLGARRAAAGRAGTPAGADTDTAAESAVAGQGAA